MAEIEPGNVFVQGAISPEFITSALLEFQKQTQLGAHDIFLGQVRADKVEGKEVVAIDYTAYAEMANKLFDEIQKSTVKKYQLSSLQVYHSLGTVKTGEICLLVMASSPHRKAVFEGLQFAVEEVKKKVPVFGKEVFKDNSYQWKVNN